MPLLFDPTRLIGLNTQEILDSTPDGILLVDATGGLAFANAAAQRLLMPAGGQPAEDPWLRRYQALLSPDLAPDVAIDALPIIQVLQGEPVVRTEVRIRRPDGQELWLSVHVSALRNSAGLLTGAISVLRDETQCKRLEAAIRESEWRFRNAVDFAPIGMALLSLEGAWLEANQALCDMLGYLPAEITQMTVQGVTHPDDLVAGQAVFQLLLEAYNNPLQMEKRYLHRTGRVVHVHLSVSLLRSEQGQPLYFIAQIQDISDRKKMEAALNASEERARLIIRNAHDAFISIDEDSRILEWNLQAEKTFGWSRSEAIGHDITQLIIPLSLRQLHLDGVRQFVEKGASSRPGQKVAVGKRVEVQAVDRTGREFPVEMTVTSLRTEGRYVFNAFIHDISERKAMEMRLVRMAQYDPLTELPNRRLFYDRLKQAILRAQRKNTLLALLYLDLNGFKRINDTYGHAAGDQALVEFAGRLRRCVRKSDTVARLAGDEFAVIVEDMKTPDTAELVANKIIRGMQAPVDVGGEIVHAIPSIGIAVFDHEDTADALVRRADARMYQAKNRNGRMRKE